MTIPGNICTNVVLGTDHPARFCADFYSICPCFVYRSVGEDMKFTIAAANKVDIVSES